MHPRLTELIAYLDRQDENLRTAFDRVPPQQRMLRPAPDRWSPAEVIHHVDIVERLIVQYVQTLVGQARALPPESDVSPLFPMATATLVEIRSRRVRTLEYAIPIDTDAERIWSAYEVTRGALKEAIAAGDGLSLGAVTVPHPRLGALTGYEWIAFAGAHAARHADQIREMTVSLA